MIKIEEKLKENGKLADFERAVELNDLQSIYEIIEELIDNSEPVKSIKYRPCYQIVYRRANE